MKKSCGCVEYAVVAVAMAVFFVFLMPTICPPHCGSRARITRCANNLSQLNKLMGIHRVRTRGTYPEETGSNLWLSFAKTDPPLIAIRDRTVLFCPVRGGEIVSDRTDYRGPAVSAGRLKEDAPLGADREENHDGEDINVLLKDGSVQLVTRDEDLWRSCRSLLSP